MVRQSFILVCLFYLFPCSLLFASCCSDLCLSSPTILVQDTRFFFPCCITSGCFSPSITTLSLQLLLDPRHLILCWWQWNACTQRGPARLKSVSIFRCPLKLIHSKAPLGGCSESRKRVCSWTGIFYFFFSFPSAAYLVLRFSCVTGTVCPLAEPPWNRSAGGRVTWVQWGQWNSLFGLIKVFVNTQAVDGVSVCNARRFTASPLQAG